MDALRNQIAANKQETEDNWFKNPMNWPKLKGKQVWRSAETQS